MDKWVDTDTEDEDETKLLDDGFDNGVEEAADEECKLDIEEACEESKELLHSVHAWLDTDGDPCAAWDTVPLLLTKTPPNAVLANAKRRSVGATMINS